MYARYLYQMVEFTIPEILITIISLNKIYRSEDCVRVEIIIHISLKPSLKFIISYTLTSKFIIIFID